MLGKNVRSRLKKDLVIWLITVGPDTKPHAVPIWFWWDGDSFLVYSVPGQKVRDIKANRSVELHFNTDPEGEEVIRVEGTATIEPGQPPATRVPAYLRKYRDQIKGFGWTTKFFSERYHIAIRVRPTRFH